MKKDGSNYSFQLLYLFLLVFIVACGTVKRGSHTKELPVETLPESSESASHEPLMSLTAGKSELNRERQDILQLAYNDWKGIPYVLGGSGYNGIDCSAFMQVVFEDYFSVILPRTTLEQMEYGAPISKRSLSPGDMVFFKTGRRTYHVGIMMNSTEFLHASTSEGVTISELTHPYWDSAFLAFRRVLKGPTTDS